MGCGRAAGKRGGHPIFVSDNFFLSLRRPPFSASSLKSMDVKPQKNLTATTKKMRSNKLIFSHSTDEGRRRMGDALISELGEGALPQEGHHPEASGVGRWSGDCGGREEAPRRTWSTSLGSASFFFSPVPSSNRLFFFSTLALCLRRPDVPNQLYWLFVPAQSQTCCFFIRAPSGLHWAFLPFHSFEFASVDCSSTHPLSEVLARASVLFPAFLLFLPIVESLHAHIFISIGRQRVLVLADSTILMQGYCLQSPRSLPHLPGPQPCPSCPLDTEGLASVLLCVSLPV